MSLKLISKKNKGKDYWRSCFRKIIKMDNLYDSIIYNVRVLVWRIWICNRIIIVVVTKGSSLRCIGMIRRPIVGLLWGLVLLYRRGRAVLLWSRLLIEVMLSTLLIINFLSLEQLRIFRLPPKRNSTKNKQEWDQRSQQTARKYSW